MKTNPFAYLAKAPNIPGLRKLKPNEKSKPGDRFTFLCYCDMPAGPREHYEPEAFTSEVTEGNVVLKLGRSLKQALEVWNADEARLQSCGAFDGVFYRPTAKKVSS